MATTTDELTVARSYIGTTEEGATFDERFDRLYALVVNTSEAERRRLALNAAIEESLRAQLAVMTLDQSTSASADGNSYNNQQNIITLSKNLEKFMATKGSTQAGVTRLKRTDAR